LRVDQRTTSWNSRYTFSAKEKDEESGYGYFGARYYDSDISIWFSVDPMSDKYPSLSPYNYCLNNPIKLLDPNGEEVIVKGDAAEEATTFMSTKNVTVIRDAETGKLSRTGEAKTSEEKMLVKAIESSDVIVNLTVNKSNTITNSEGTPIKDGNGNPMESGYGGAFMGNCLNYADDGNTKANSAETQQFVSMDKLKNVFSKTDIGTALIHEITESFIGGKISIESGNSANPAVRGVANKIFWQAHNNASAQPLTIKQKKDAILKQYPILKELGKINF
jgi:RHS repeat-associated protein